MTENCCRWKSTSGLDGKRLFAYNLRTNETNFKIQTAYVKAQLQWLIKISVAKNLLPVLAENGYLLIIQELIDEFSEFKRQMFRFDSNENLKILFLKIYFRCKQKIWKWALKHYFEKENPFRIERVTPSVCIFALRGPNTLFESFWILFWILIARKLMDRFSKFKCQ